MLLCIGLVPAIAFAADVTPELKVNGVDTQTVPSGAGWSYDSATNTLTLDGYNGGSIIARNMDLTVVLAQGSTNVISTSEASGIACEDSHDLWIVGNPGSTLDITATNHAIFTKGSISIRGCTLTAKNTTASGATYSMECIFSQGRITIENCTVNVTTATGVGIACYEEHTIHKSIITISAGMIGIYTSNKNLTISDSTLDATGSSTAALMSVFGTVQLTNCTGKLNAGTAAIYAKNLTQQYHGQKSDTEIRNCELAITAPYGVRTYSDTLVEGGKLTFDCTTMGIYSALPNSYDAKVQVKENAAISGSSSTPQLMQVNGRYITDETVDVTGVILKNTGDPATTRYLLVGSLIIPADQAYSKNVLIPAGSNVTVASGASFDLSSAPSVTIDGTLTNHGILQLSGAATTNNGKIYNYDKIVLADNHPIMNNKTIYSVCTSDFDLTPYYENGIVLHANLIQVDETPATHLTEGNIEYWYCDSCGKLFGDMAGTREIFRSDTVIPSIMEHAADSTGWHSNENVHWYTCTCGKVIDEAAHIFQWVTDKVATATEMGSRHEECSVCGYKRQAESIPMIVVTQQVPPKTGDSSCLTLWAVLLMLSGAGLARLAASARQRSRRP